MVIENQVIHEFMILQSKSYFDSFGHYKYKIGMYKHINMNPSNVGGSNTLRFTPLSLCKVPPPLLEELELPTYAWSPSLCESNHLVDRGTLVCPCNWKAFNVITLHKKQKTDMD